MNRSSFEVADVIERFGNEFYVTCKPNGYQQKTKPRMIIYQNPDLNFATNLLF